MKILVTGAQGFMGKNLCARLAERPDIEVFRFTRKSSHEQLGQFVSQADFIFHLAGVNRPQDFAEFEKGNLELTSTLAEFILASGRRIPIVFASSIQAERDNPYGRSKLAAEDVLRRLAGQSDTPVYIFRLPNVFGKWCAPDYNSVVATYCHNIARDLPIRIDNPDVELTLQYIDDVMEKFLSLIDCPPGGDILQHVTPEYQISLGDLAACIKSFSSSRNELVVGAVGAGLTRALYSTYVSYLPPADFSRVVPIHGDARGVFVEMLKTENSGQFSYFTAHPGITRGGHYHHSKTEKFLVVKGKARFGFRHLVTDEYRAIYTTGDKPEVVDTVPGWTHDITNVGDDEMIVMLWANEIFNRERPDTYGRPVNHE
jgi:UDP-2-acetamido-2,6-beta-L-arabino-hexul-4-ose reductase